MGKTIIQEMYEAGELNKFEGGPEDSDLLGEPVTPAGSEKPKVEKPASDVKPAKEEKPAVEDKHPAQIAQEEEDRKEKELVAKAGELKPAAAPQFKFKNQEEAEKAATTAQQKITEQGQQLSTQKRELDELKKKFSIEADKEFVSKITQETSELLSKVDPEDPEFMKKQTQILIDTNQKMLDHRLEKLSADNPQSPPVKPSNAQSPEITFQEADRQVTDYLKQQNLDAPEHKELFWMSYDYLKATDPEFMALAVKTENFGDNPATNKIVDRVKKLVGMTEEKLKKINSDNHEASLETEALGRGAKKIDTVVEDAKPKTMTEQILEANKSRRF
jgi:hypothetical protein